MSRNALIAVLVSLLVHAGAAASGAFFREKPAEVAIAAEVPTIALDQPPPLEPEEPEALEAPGSEAPPEILDLAPPMQADLPSATIDSAFSQQWKPAPPQINNSGKALDILPTTRPAVNTGKGLGNIFDLSALDQRPEARVRINPVYPHGLKRSGLRGEVLVGFIVDSNGEVRDPYIVKSTHSGFENAALQAVAKWKFKPGRKGGVAVNTRIVQPFAFNIEV